MEQEAAQTVISVFQIIVVIAAVIFVGLYIFKSSWSQIRKRKDEEKKSLDKYIKPQKSEDNENKQSSNEQMIEEKFRKLEGQESSHDLFDHETDRPSDVYDQIYGEKKQKKRKKK